MACAGVTVVKRARPCSAACVLIASCPQVKATGWAASKAKLLDEACARAQGNGRSLALEQRWGKLLVKVMQGVGSEQFCMLAQELVEPKALLELSLHPHGSQVLQAVLRQLALFLSLPEMAVPCENASCSRQAVCNLLRSLYDAARATLLQEDTLQQLLAEAPCSCAIYARLRAATSCLIARAPARPGLTTAAAALLPRQFQVKQPARA
jgi:hypothetical protein